MLLAIPSSPSLLVAASSGSGLVAQIGVCFLAAAVFAVLCERARLPSIAACVLAGVLIGPVGLKFVESKQDIEVIANLGLTLLLFLIGLEINLRSLLASGRVLVVTGILQVPLVFAAAYVIFSTLAGTGVPLLASAYAPLYFALACAFSSTLLVAKALHDRLQMDTVDGRLCIGLLIFQDIWAIVTLALQPNLHQPSLAPLLQTLGGVVIVATVATALTRFVLPTAFRWVAKSPELVVTLALGWCFGLGLFAGNLGAALHRLNIPHDLSLSMEMGALIAGASIASFPYAHEVVAKVGNLRDFFITLFFVALGMSVPVPEDTGIVMMAVMLTFVLVALRYVVFMPLLYWTGLDRRHAVTTSTKLAQVSEFALVIGYIGIKLGHVDSALVGSIIFAFVLTAILTPALFTLADPLHRRVGPWLAWLGLRQQGNEDPEGEHDRPPRLVILGFHRLASSLLHDLARTHADLIPDTLIIDYNVAIHPSIRLTGARVLYGDISNPSTLEHANVASADVILCAVTDDILKGINNEGLTRELRRLAPNAVLIMNAVRIADVESIRRAGADYVFSWRTETSWGVIPAVCAALNGDMDGFTRAQRVDTGGDLASRQEVLD